MGCETTLPVQNTPVPPNRPARVAPVKPAAPAVQSQHSLDLARYYQRVQNDLTAQDLLRTDGGGPDTQFGADTLLRNFEQIAFYDEYARGGGLSRSSGAIGRLKKWQGPVRMTVQHGKFATEADRARDYAEVANYAARLARVTGHPIGMSQSSANFHVLFMGEDDADTLKDRVRTIVPEINPNALAIFNRLPRSVHCLVLAFAGTENSHGYARAIAVIRAEHPDLMRKSCIHEELAQGLGLANDSPRARPSIFNDDDEFALLTTHDEMLLRMLYDPRLTPGMTLEAARPILTETARKLTGGNS